MIKKILIGFVIATVVLLLLLWLLTGGFRKIADTVRSFPDFFGFSATTTTPGEFRLPWQPEGLMLGADLSDLGGQGGEGSETLTPEEELDRSQKEYEEILKKMEDAKTFGEPSPYRDLVRLSAGNAAEGSVSGEYVEITATGANTAPVNLAGWSLQSALTGVRTPIPRGADLFILGNLNTQKDIYLNPGAGAIVSSGISPVGTSFRENTCTGYLTGLQTFAPPLSGSCPSPSESLPLTPDNLRTYGDACYDFVQDLPPCVFPRETPANIAPACRIFLMNNISYNGCVQNYQYKSSFSRDSWRIYLGASRELWRNSHDIIRLLDGEGRTVDVISY